MAQTANVNSKSDVDVEDPFYSAENIRYMEKKVSEHKEGKLKLVEHDLIEDK